MKRLTRYAGLVALLFCSFASLTGCSTIATVAGAATDKCDCDPRYIVPRVYSGVTSDIRFLRVSGEDAGLLLYDLPLSLAADTLVLPYTIVMQCKHGNICISDGGTNAPPQNVPTDEQHFFMKQGHANTPFSGRVSSGNLFLL